MNQHLFIVFNRNGFDRCVKTEPTHKVGEYVAHVIIGVPDEVFRRQPIPVIKVMMPTSQVGVPEVTVDGQPVPHSFDEAVVKQYAVQKQLHELLQASRKSDDPAMRASGDAVLAALMASGVEVSITSEAFEEETAL